MPSSPTPLGDEQFLNVLAHELSNPIAAIIMASETLTQLCGDVPDAGPMIDIVRRQAVLAKRLLDDLLDVSRIGTGKIQLRKSRIDLAEPMRTAFAACQADLKAHRLSAHLDLPARPIWIDADGARVTQILGKLLQNAIKFNRPGGEVILRARSDDRGRTAVIEVLDTGIGIAPDAIRKLFVPVRETDPAAARSRSGLGLGLVLAKGLVELHGGSIAVESEGPDKGSSFRVSLPLAADPGAASGAGDTAAAARWPLRILIIDDSPDVVASLEFLLKVAGHELASTGEGRQGVERARQWKPDVVLCDINLSGMDGYAVARELRADPSTASIYLIAVSGYGSPEYQRRSLDAGFDLHLNKPEGFVGLNELLQKLPIGRERGSS
jgi:CheY-like chemotaxis protein